MSSLPLSALNSIWLKWKSLKLPWRKRWLAGTDLSGNTFWYFKPVIYSGRARRILQHDPQIPYSDIQISPQWHQWLRYTRPTPPSMAEQQADAARQRQLKYLAQAADERWAAKPSVLDRPRSGNFELGFGDGEAGSATGLKVEEREKRDAGETVYKGKQNDSPWKRKPGNPGEAWQPEAWAPERLNR